MSNNRERIGLLLAEARKAAGLTVRQLGEQAGLDPSNISKIEKGKYNVSIDILSKVADVLHVELDLTPKRVDFQSKAIELLDEMYRIIYPIIEEMGTFKMKINYVECVVQILNDDASTLWVEWGKDNCAFRDLNIFAMSTIANQIQMYYEEAKEDGLTSWDI